VEDIEDFVIKSSFVGREQKRVMDLNLDSANKIFTYNKPVLLLLLNKNDPSTKGFEEELSQAFEEVSELILVCSVDVNIVLGQKFA